MSDNNRDEETTKQVTPPEQRNPTGKGGFGDNPQNRSDGRWKKENTISYQYNYLMSLPIDELQYFEPKTVAQKIALARVKTAITTEGLHDTKEITDRTEGKAPQSVDLTTKGESINPITQLSAEELRKLASE